MSNALNYQFETSDEQLFFLEQAGEMPLIRMGLRDGDGFAEARLNACDISILIGLLQAAQAHLSQVVNKQES